MKNEGNTRMRCLLSGELTEPVRLTPKVGGLRSVGGHSTGDKLIAFDKEAFSSFGLEGGKNAACSEEAASLFTTALDDLIRKAPIPLAGVMFLHWYKEHVPDELDILRFFDGIPVEGDASAINKADELIEAVQNGKYPNLLNNTYYILLLSGANGRIMIRSYLQGSYRDLVENMQLWFNDLRLILPSGKGRTKTPKLFALYIRLLSYEKNTSEKNTRRLGERMAKELSATELHVKYSIINGTSLPDRVPAKALNYMRSRLFASNENGGQENLDSLACQWLKIWLIRKEREKGEVSMTEELNENYPNPAYHAGRMLAVLAQIQHEALGDVGAGIVQRFYAAASTSPALVLGRLTTLTQHHLAKINNKAFVNRYERMLSEIASKLQGAPLISLNLEQQTMFALGYYQQKGQMLISKRNQEE